MTQAQDNQVPETSQVLDTNPETIKSRRESTGVLKITRSLDGQTVQIYFKHPDLADVVEKMANSNAPSGEYHQIYKPILVETEETKAKGRCFTKAAVTKISHNFIADPGFDWETPRAVLIYNPKALREGFTLTYKVDRPFTPDQAHRWGKQLLDGCNDILANAKAFTVTWVTRSKETNPIQEADREIGVR